MNTSVHVGTSARLHENQRYMYVRMYVCTHLSVYTHTYIYISDHITKCALPMYMQSWWKPYSGCTSCLGAFASSHCASGSPRALPGQQKFSTVIHGTGPTWGLANPPNREDYDPGVLALQLCVRTTVKRSIPHQANVWDS